MNKRYIHHLLKQLQKLHYLYLVVALLISGTVFILAYRQNNLGALQLRDQVLAADKADADVEAPLKKLREYTYSHMNSSLAGGANAVYPPIQLKYRYERLVAAEKARVDAATSALNAAAQPFCDDRIASGKATNRESCVQDYIQTHNPPFQKEIPDALYKFDFAAPIWSPDLAGWSLLATALLGVALIIRMSLEYWLRMSLHE